MSETPILPIPNWAVSDGDYMPLRTDQQGRLMVCLCECDHQTCPESGSMPLKNVGMALRAYLRHHDNGDIGIEVFYRDPDDDTCKPVNMNE